MKFSEILDGLKNGQCATRSSCDSFCGKMIVMQIPQTVPASVVPKMTSLPEEAKVRIGTIGLHDETLGTIQYHDQVLLMTCNDFERVSATSYTPTWEDIFAEDWMFV